MRNPEGRGKGHNHIYRSDISDQDIKDLYAKLKNTHKVAKSLGVTKTTVLRRLHKMGAVLPVNHSRQNNVSTEQLKTEYKDGKSVSQLSRDHGLSTQAVSNRLERAGVVIDLHPQKLDIDEQEVIDQYVNRGKTGKQIAAERSCCDAVIYDILEAAGIDRRKEYWHSAAENDLRAFLETSTGKKWPSTNIGNRQLDLYNDELKLAIEYCGLYWHCEYHATYRDQLRHWSKMDLCASKGIRLITIFEDEWLNRTDLVKSILLSKIGVFDRRVGAGKCKPVELDKQTAKDFIQSYHLQGMQNTSITHALGLTFKGELLAVATLGVHHRGGSLPVLNRLCFKSGVQVVGGASRLVVGLQKRCNSAILSWSDNRWSDGSVYYSIGFKLDGNLKPDYSYVDLGLKVPRRISKQSMKKKEASVLTEREIALGMKRYRIWDCGKKRWVLPIL